LKVIIEASPRLSPQNETRTHFSILAQLSSATTSRARKDQQRDAEQTEYAHE
jgi:hypothetical protein